MSISALKRTLLASLLLLTTIPAVSIAAEPAAEPAASAASGETVAFSTANNPQNPIQRALQIAYPDGTVVDTGITSNYGLTLSWSPDGSKIALGLHRDSSTSNPDIYVVNADGSDLRRLTTLGGEMPTWSPDGSKIAFITRRYDATNEIGYNPMLYVMNSDGSDQRRLGHTPGAVAPGDPEWSPDGNEIVFASQGSLYTMQSDGSSYRQIHSNTNYYLSAAPTWSNDSSEIYFVSNRERPSNTGPFDLYAMNRDGSAVERLTTEGGFHNPKFSSDGSKLYMMSAPHKSLIYLSADNSAYSMDLSVTDYSLSPSGKELPRWRAAETPTPAPEEVPVHSVYRFWSSKFGNAHFYTMNAEEAARIIATDRNWVYQGDTFGAFAAVNGECEAGEPVYRFWSGTFQSHFFTRNPAEKDHLIARDRNWHYEGIAYCADPQKLDDNTPLHRFWSSRYGKHFYTSNEAEKNHLIANDRAWSYEGPAYYVIP